MTCMRAFRRGANPIEPDCHKYIDIQQKFHGKAPIQAEPIVETSPEQPDKSTNSSIDEEDSEDPEWLHSPP